MSFFNWFSGRSDQHSSLADLQPRHGGGAREKSSITPPPRLVPEPGSVEHKRKLERYARREQLYTAIREAMTRAGILSASYKFKVLSLDRRDSEFLVMMDVSKMAGDFSVKTGEMEALVVHNAKARFDITVSAVYWRINATIALGKAVPCAPEASVVVKTDLKKAHAVHELIEADEIAAFQRALLARHSAAAPLISLERDGRSGIKNTRANARKLADSETSDSVSPRSLSGTQYGELN